MRTLADWSVDLCADGPDSPTSHTVKVTPSAPSPCADQPVLQSSINVVNGRAYPPSCSQQRWAMLDAAMLGRYRSSDVLIVTYPKCGTTWAEQCSLLLLHGASSELNPAHKNTYVPGANEVGKIWVEAAVLQDPALWQRTGQEFKPLSWEQFDSAPAPRVLKSHARFARSTALGFTSSSALTLACGSVRSLLGTAGEGAAGLPQGTKVVVVTRNPMDACVSCYYHAWNPSKSGWPFSAWAALWASGNTASGSWFDWTREWWAAARPSPGGAHVHWVHYEDLKSDPAGTVGALAAFLGVTDQGVVASAVALSTFDSMKEQAAAKVLTPSSAAAPRD